MKGNREHLPINGPGSAYVATIAVLMKATEERWLRDLHGQEYENYCNRVNRCILWFPRA